MLRLDRISFGGLVPLLAMSVSLAGGLRPEDMERVPQRWVDDGVRVAYHAETGKVRFLGSVRAQPMDNPAAATALPGAPARSRLELAIGFLGEYAELFGLRDPRTELSLRRERSDGSRHVVRLQQVYRGIPVLGAELNIELTPAGDVVSVAGEVAPDLALPTTAQIDAATATGIALASASKWHAAPTAELAAAPAELWIYDPRMLPPGTGPARLVWRTEVRSTRLQPIRELVLVDATDGSVALHFNQVHAAKDRETYDAMNTTTLPGTLTCSETMDPTCSAGDSHEAGAHLAAGESYDYYSANFGRDGMDGVGGKIISSVHYDVGLSNAFWDGTQMVFGDGLGYPEADDVVGHEYTHGVTDAESNLFYYFQSGAINEVLSDVFGELIDLDNGRGTDGAPERWLIGEDIGGGGAIRDMEDPPASGDPDSMSSHLWLNTAADNGGVHTNSGVGNKTAFLIADGGTHNGITVTGLGLTKMATIFYELQVSLLTSGSDYADMYDMLFQACLNKVGTAGIVTADCDEVRKATDAVHMYRLPSPDVPWEAPLCTNGQYANTLFFDDLENAGANFTVGSAGATPEWYVSGSFAKSGTTSLFGVDDVPSNDTWAAMALDVQLPEGNSYLNFHHAYDFEIDEVHAYDGGIVEYSTDGGSTWFDTLDMMEFRPYNGHISTCCGNPLASAPAYVGISGGYIATRINLAPLAGSTVRFRWRFGTDASGDSIGWFVDDIRIYTCSADGDELTVDFGAGRGLWQYNHGSWKKATNLDATHVAPLVGKFAAGFTGSGTWLYDGSWTRITLWEPTVMAAWGSKLAIGFGMNRGTWIYDETGWTKISAWDPFTFGPMSDKLAVGFDMNRGLWLYSATSGWTKISGWDPEQMKSSDLN